MAKSAFAPIVLPLAALIGSLVRWLVQGSGNVYTAVDKRFYVPDPDLGWRESTDHPIWLGLEVCAGITAVAVGIAIGGWIIRRRERSTGRTATILRSTAWVVAAAPLVVPIAAFATGFGPEGGRSVLPDTTPVAIGSGSSAGSSAAPGITGSLALPAGTYAIVAHPGTALTARVSAGGETFDARFTGKLDGSWQGDPSDLAKPMTAAISVDAATVDTGIGERSKHAREGYLKADKFPKITFALDKLTAARPSAADLAFSARGTVGLIGKQHQVDVTGTLKKPDAAALQRLGLTGDVMLVQADFAIPIRETALSPDAGDFDGDRIPIHVSLVLRR